MSRVNVDDQDLIRFKATLERNAQRFDEIRNTIGSSINAIINTDWQDQKSEQFRDVFFSQSDPDILNLVQLMQSFSTYLQTKIDKLQEYQSTNINFV